MKTFLVNMNIFINDHMKEVCTYVTNDTASNSMNTLRFVHLRFFI